MLQRRFRPSGNRPPKASYTPMQLDRPGRRAKTPEALRIRAVVDRASQSMAGNTAFRHHMPNKVYITPPFPKGADLTKTETALAQKLLQVQHDAILYPLGDDEASISIMRRHAISFNLKVGNTIIALNWDPSQFSRPKGEDHASENIYTGNSGPSAEGASWQYCLAPSYAENKVYISSPFPKSASLHTGETAFAKMLVQSKIQHDGVQCPNGNDRPSIWSMRAHAISFNHDLGKTIIILDQTP